MRDRMAGRMGYPERPDRQEHRRSDVWMQQRIMRRAARHRGPNVEADIPEKTLAGKAVFSAGTASEPSGVTPGRLMISILRS